MESWYGAVYMWKWAYKLLKSALVIKWEIIFSAVLECVSLSPRPIQFPQEETPFSSQGEIPSCHHWLYKCQEWGGEKARFDPSVSRLSTEPLFLAPSFIPALYYIQQLPSNNPPRFCRANCLDASLHTIQMMASSIHFTSSIYIFQNFVQIALPLSLLLILFVAGDLTFFVFFISLQWNLRGEISTCIQSTIFFFIFNQKTSNYAFRLVWVLEDHLLLCVSRGGVRGGVSP